MLITSGVFSQTPEIINLPLATEFDRIYDFREIDNDMFFMCITDYFLSITYGGYSIIKVSEDGNIARKMINREDGYRIMGIELTKISNEILVFYITYPRHEDDPTYNPDLHKDIKFHFAKLDDNLNLYDQKEILIGNTDDYTLAPAKRALIDKDHTAVVWLVKNDDWRNSHMTFCRVDLEAGEILHSKEYQIFYTGWFFSSSPPSLPYDSDVTAFVHNADSSGFYYFAQSKYTDGVKRHEMDEYFQIQETVDLILGEYGTPSNKFAAWDSGGHRNGANGDIYFGGTEHITYTEMYPNYKIKSALFVAKIDSEPRLKYVTGEEPKFKYDYPAWRQPIDFITSDKIFFGGHLEWDEWNPYHPTYWVLRCFDADLNLIREHYYRHEGDVSQDLGAVHATSDGGCILLGGYRNDYTYYTPLVIKFPAEAFVNIEEAHKHGLSVAVVYPNPGNEKMCVRTAVPKAEVEVYDISGKLVLKQNITDTETVLSTETWNTGTYIWRVYSEGKIAETGKWIKQ